MQPVHSRPCPRCELPLQARTIADVVIDECGRCGGVFVDREAVELLLADVRDTRADALLASLVRAEHHPLPPAGARMYVKCPTCSAMMNRKLFASGSGIVVDVCKSHGTFFDAGELPAILELVQRGGLERAARRTDDDRDRERRERQERIERAGSSSATHVGGNGTALVELLFWLFR